MFTNKIDEDFQSMISKRYGVELSNPTRTKSIFECLDKCDAEERKSYRLNEGLDGKCCGKKCEAADEDEFEVEFEAPEAEVTGAEEAPAEAAEEGEFSNDKYTVELNGEDGYKVTALDSGKVYKLVEGKALGGTADLGAVFIVDDAEDEMTCAGFVDGTEVNQDLFDAVFEAIEEYEAEEAEDSNEESDEEKADEFSLDNEDDTTTDESLNEFRNPFSQATKDAKNRAQELKNYAHDYGDTSFEPNNFRDSAIAKWISKYRYLTFNAGKFVGSLKIVDYDKTATGTAAGKTVIVEPTNQLSADFAKSALSTNADGKYTLTFDEIGNDFGGDKGVVATTPNGKKMTFKFTSLPHGMLNKKTFDDVQSAYDNGEFGQETNYNKTTMSPIR